MSRRAADTGFAEQIQVQAGDKVLDRTDGTLASRDFHPCGKDNKLTN